MKKLSDFIKDIDYSNLTKIFVFLDECFILAGTASEFPNKLSKDCLEEAIIYAECQFNTDWETNEPIGKKFYDYTVYKTNITDNGNTLQIFIQP